MAGNGYYHMYTYDLPFAVRKTLCKILDINNSWEELGGNCLRYDVGTLNRIGQAVLRNRSPTDELLTLWETKNSTVHQLFGHLATMQHYQAMATIKKFVDPKYHNLIYEGEENFSKIHSPESPPKKPLQPYRNEPVSPTNTTDANQNLNLNKNHQDNSKNKILMKNALVKDLTNSPRNPNLDFKEDGARALKKTTDIPIGEGTIPLISYSELEFGTEGWNRRELLGKGGFGAVYKGIWKNTLVAIKRLEMQKGGDAEELWKTYREQSLRELKHLNSCRHDNILPMYAYSIDGPYDCLVYQFMPNGSLEDRLLCKSGTKPLSWCQRHSIATGTARGLQFLHTIGDKPLVHGDIKSANILLDSYLEPKIGDFGLAREGPLQQYSHIELSRVHGTRPYLPDEFLRAKKFSIKVDTFSFGIITKNFPLMRSTKCCWSGIRSLSMAPYITDGSKCAEGVGCALTIYSTEIMAIRLALECILLRSLSGTEKQRVEALPEDQLHCLMDTKINKDYGSFQTLIKLGKACVSLRPRERPEMVAVLQKLDSDATTCEMAQQNWAVASPVTPIKIIEEMIANPPISSSPEVETEIREFIPLLSNLGKTCLDTPSK